MSGDAIQLADEIATACRICHGEGLARAFGHVSARVSEGEFLISRRMGLASITPVDVERLEVGARELPSGSGTVPIEAFIHSAIYAKRPDVTSVVRAHPDACSVLGILGIDVHPVHAFGTIIGESACIHDSPELVTTAELGDAVAEGLGDRSVIVLRGNGTVAVGSSVREACVRTIYLEETARFQLMALSAGRQAPAITGDVVGSIRAGLETPSQIDRSWNHFSTVHR